MNRDEKGNLLPRRHVFHHNDIEYEIYIIPLVRGEVKKVEIGKLSDEEILDKIDVPKYSREEMDRLKPEWRKILIKEVMKVSGVSFVDKKENSLEVKDQWARDLMEKKANKNNRRLLLFLHRNGYNFFNLNNLTIDEVNSLVEAFNEEQNEIERNSRKNIKRR